MSATILFCAAIGTLLPAAYGAAAGVPEPRFHDEYSYLLGADTFAHRRLTNPAPRLPEFFEAEHIIVTPTYQSKYPPTQALILAAGQVLLGHPIWGVWLSCGLFAGCLCWMLQASVSRHWAVIVTVASSITLGTATYWAQSYWGGMAAASGSALLFGALIRTMRSPTIVVSVLMGTGALILANSRPYEGFLACVPAAAMVVHWGVRNRASLGQALSRLLLPLAAVSVVGVGAMLQFNRAVTGEYWRPPYLVHVNQYLYRDLFIFSPERQPALQPIDRVRRFYEALGRPSADRWSAPAEGAKNFVIRLPMSLAVAFGLVHSPHLTDEPARGGFRGVTLWLLLLLAYWLPVPIPMPAMIFGVAAALLTEVLAWWYVPAYPGGFAPMILGGWAIVSFRTLQADRWTRLIGSTIVLVMSGQALMWWWAPHYVAPLIPLTLIPVAMSLDRHSETRRSLARVPVSLGMIVLLSVYSSATVMMAVVTRQVANHMERKTTRGDVEGQLGRSGRLNLVFVNYDPKYPLDSEWVYNGADLSEAPVLFVHDLGDDRNAQLIDAYPGRTSWRLIVSTGQVSLLPYSRTSAGLAARKPVSQ